MAVEASSKKHPNYVPFWKRKYLVQKAYQIRYSLLIALIGALALLLAYHSIKYVVLTNLLPLSIPNINIYKVTIFMFVSWFLLGVIYTHTTAGPITQLIRQIINITEKRLDEARVMFRRGDDLQDLPEYFNNMVKVLQFRSKEDKVLKKEICSYLNQVIEKDPKELKESDENLQEALKYCSQRIQNLLQKKKRYLSPKTIVRKDNGIE